MEPNTACQPACMLGYLGAQLDSALSLRFEMRCERARVSPKEPKNLTTQRGGSLGGDTPSRLVSESML